MDFRDKMMARINMANEKSLTEEAFVGGDMSALEVHSQYCTEVDNSVDAISIDVDSLFINRIKTRMSCDDRDIIFAKDVQLPQSFDRIGDYEVLTFAGERYIMSTKVNMDLVKRYEEEIIAELCEGKEYTLDLLTTDVVSLDGSTEVFPIMTHADWNYLCSRFRNYNAYVIMTDSDIVLKVEKLEVFK